jgi:hypothetical protein
MIGGRYLRHQSSLAIVFELDRLAIIDIPTSKKTGMGRGVTPRLSRSAKSTISLPTARCSENL